MTQPSPELYRALLVAYAANSAAAELMRETHLGDPLQWRLDGTTTSLGQWLERHAPTDDEPPVTARVTPVTQQPATTAAEAATTQQPATATDAVLIAKAQLGDGVTAREIASWVGRRYGLETDAAKVRALLAKARSKGLIAPPVTPPQPEPQPEPGTGGYL